MNVQFRAKRKFKVGFFRYKILPSVIEVKHKYYVMEMYFAPGGVSIQYMDWKTKNQNKRRPLVSVDGATMKIAVFKMARELKNLKINL